MLKEVAPDIFRISQNKRSWLTPFSVNVFVIAGEDGLVFDAGLGGRKSGRYMAEKLREIEALMANRGKPCSINRVMISHGHWDHFSGAAYLRDKLGLSVLVNEDMFHNIRSMKNFRKKFRRETPVTARLTPLWMKTFSALGRLFIDLLMFSTFNIRFVPAPVEFVSDRSTLSIDGNPWEVMMIPGHSDDDMVLLNREKGILLSGDIVLRAVNTWLGPPRSSLELYMQSLSTMKNIPGLTLILPSHGSAITEPYKRLEEAIEHRKKRTLEVLRIVKNSGDNGISFEKLFKTIYPSLRLQERVIARGWIIVTLMYLMEQDTIVSRIVKGEKRFYSAT